MNNKQKIITGIGVGMIIVGGIGYFFTHKTITVAPTNQVAQQESAPYAQMARFAPISGTIGAISSDSIMVKNSSGEESTIKLSDLSSVTKLVDSQMSDLIKTGENLEIVYTTTSNAHSAISITRSFIGQNVPQRQGQNPDSMMRGNPNGNQQAIDVSPMPQAESPESTSNLRAMGTVKSFTPSSVTVSVRSRGTQSELTFSLDGTVYRNVATGSLSDLKVGQSVRIMGPTVTIE